MPFPFILPTTSRLNFQKHLTSSTHPSLPASATSQRNAFYSALKHQKRLSESDQSRNYQDLLGSITSYLPFLLSIDAAVSGKPIAGEDVDAALTSELEVEWRSTLASSNIPGRDNIKVKGKGLDYEIFSALQALATLHYLIARQSCLDLYASATPNPEQRLGIIQSASKAYMVAFSIHDYLAQQAISSDGPTSFPVTAVDVSSYAQSALADLCRAETTLCFVLKDDPYPAILLQSLNKDDKEWMIKAPEIPKLRAQVLARLCVSAAEKAGRAATTLKVEGRVSKDLVNYCEDLKKTARAKASRFLAIDADAGGETGKGIAWLRAGMNELGMDVPQNGRKAGGLNKLKASWVERREDRRLEKGVGNWGFSSGKSEEGRILEWLDRKWTKINDTVNVQLVPDWKPLSANLPSGRDILVANAWIPPLLMDDVLTSMRAPPDPADNVSDSDSSDDGKNTSEGATKVPIGAFPGTKQEYGSADQYY